MMAFWNWLMELLGLTTVHKFDHFATTVGEIRGYGNANGWIDMSVSETAAQAEAMVKAGVNTTVLELLSFSESGYYDKPDKAIDKFFERAPEFLKRRVTILLVAVNGNHAGLCDPKYDSAWAANLYKRIKTELGVEGIILEMVSEWGPGERNKKCWRKLESWCIDAIGGWPGMKAWNKDARPGTAQPGHLLDYHPLRMTATGPKNCLVVTDSSSVLDELGGMKNWLDPVKVSRWAKRVRAAGKGPVLYQYQTPTGKPDWIAINALSES